MPGCGASGASASGRRSTPSVRRISSSAVWPVRSIVSSASRARSGSRSSMRRAPWACTTITPTLCATTSCSSRAIRARSSPTATRSRWRCSRSSIAMRSRRERTLRPRSHGVATTRPAENRKLWTSGSLAITCVHSPATPTAAPASAAPVLGVRAERVERDRAREQRRGRRRLAVEQAAAEDRAQRRGRGEDDARPPAARAGERRAAASAAAPPTAFTAVAAGMVAQRSWSCSAVASASASSPSSRRGIDARPRWRSTPPTVASGVAARPRPHG